MFRYTCSTRTFVATASIVVIMMALSLLSLTPSSTSTPTSSSTSTTLQVNKGGSGHIYLVHERNSSIRVKVSKGSLDDYMDTVEVKSITIDSHVKIIEDVLDDGTIHYQLIFTFGPDGLFFDEENPLALTIKGKYAKEGLDLHFVDEDGESLEYFRQQGKHKVTYFIYHFSHYYYDGYDTDTRDNN